MAITQEDLSASRPPPRSSRSSIQLFTPGVPWYRDVRIIRIVAQVVFAIAALGALFVLFSNLVTNLEQSNLSLDFTVYSRPFTVSISEGISLTEDWAWINNVDLIALVIGGMWLVLVVLMAWTLFRQYRSGQVKTISLATVLALIIFIVLFTPNDIAVWLSETMQTYLYGGSMTRAFVTGIVNTLRIVVVSLIASTMLGILVGVGLLSNNFLVRGVAKVYVEIFRNTPLLVQLFFIYRTMTLLLPFPRQSIFSPGWLSPENNLYAINARGFYFASLVPTDRAVIVYVALAVAVIGAWFVRRWRLRLHESTGQPARIWRYISGFIVVVVALGWLIAGTPFTVDYPELTGPNIQGGTQITIGFMALFLGLTLYTAAFIAEIVRAGIQAVPYGQIEAARSQGFTGGQVLNLVVLPQALRLIIPPLGNQYVNLGKNSSLGLIVNYADTYRIATLANNESGQAVPFFAGLMLIYLALSLVLSVLTNLVNRSIQVQTR